MLSTTSAILLDRLMHSLVGLNGLKSLCVLALIPPVLVRIQEHVHLLESELVLVIQLVLDLVHPDMFELLHRQVPLLMLLFYRVMGPTGPRLLQFQFILLLQKEVLVSQSCKAMDHHEELVSLLICQVTLLSSIFFELSEQVVASFLLRVAYILLKPELEIGVKNGK